MACEAHLPPPDALLPGAALVLSGADAALSRPPAFTPTSTSLFASLLPPKSAAGGASDAMSDELDEHEHEHVHDSKSSSSSAAAAANGTGQPLSAGAALLGLSLPPARDVRARHCLNINIHSGNRKVCLQAIFEFDSDSTPQHILLGRSKIHGWGAFTKEPIKKNEFVTEYTGEVRTLTQPLSFFH